MAWNKRDIRDRDEYAEWKALPLSERYVWRHIAIFGFVILVSAVICSRLYAAAS